GPSATSPGEEAISANQDAPPAHDTVAPAEVSPEPARRRVPCVSISADTLQPVGRSVASIVGDALSGAGATLAGIAVVGQARCAGGIWQYSIDGGRRWRNLGAVYHGKARLLRGIDRLRFVAGAGCRGRALLTFRSWDRSNGSPGATVNLSSFGTTGEGTAFGATVATAVLEVTPAVGAWTPNEPYSEGGSAGVRGMSVAQLVGAGGKDGPSRGIAVVRLTGTAHGVWQFSLDGGATWMPF